MSKIPEGPNAAEIQNLFTSIAHGYDQANDLITFGMARLWRRQLVKMSGVNSGAQVLDCATGTGDLAFEFKRAVGKDGTVIGTDFCAAMLEQAPAKAKSLRLDVDFQTANVMQLPFPENSFDVCSIAYGIRNVEDPIKALAEMARVVKPGGRVMILETGDAQWRIMTKVFDFYFRNIVPRLGGWITGRRDAYEYLNRSSKKFPCRNAFLEMMNATGSFAETKCRPVMGGASFIYTGIVDTVH
jgi:demethylmenaquinone methyltransferase/2-methoxy-6-polyprenyl-1,4-benzoquinol methylase